MTLEAEFNNLSYLCKNLAEAFQQAAQTANALETRLDYAESLSAKNNTILQDILNKNL